MQVSINVECKMMRRPVRTAPVYEGRERERPIFFLLLCDCQRHWTRLYILDFHLFRDNSKGYLFHNFCLFLQE